MSDGRHGTPPNVALKMNHLMRKYPRHVGKIMAELSNEVFDAEGWCKIIDHILKEADNEPG